MLRPAAVAGKFYPARAEALAAEILRCTGGPSLPAKDRQKAVGALCPHAGYMYSGAVAGSVYRQLRVPGSVILLGPNHTGLGPDFSVMAEGGWEIPTGVLPVDGSLAGALISESALFKEDVTAHSFEHSLEVQLPFIKFFNERASIVPVVIGRASLPELEDAGGAVARAIKEYGREVLIIASSDMSHYVPDATARKMDRLAIERMLALDPEGLYNTVTSHRISMCGFMPATVMLYAARALGAGGASLTSYATSGETSGDMASVVGYAGIVVR